MKHCWQAADGSSEGVGDGVGVGVGVGVGTGAGDGDGDGGNALLNKRPVPSSTQLTRSV